MVFSSYVFVFAFLPLTLLLYFGLAKYRQFAAQKWVLIAASLIFYGYFYVGYLPIIAGSIFINYALALWIQRRESALLCAVGVIFNLGLLGYYKYFDFFVENVNALFGTQIPLKHILLPLGISFFTFQQLSFLISVYQKEERVAGFADYAAFVLFFPQLVAGPIVLYSEMIPQFKDDKNLFLNWENLGAGMFLFVLGLFKKLVVADTLAVVATAGFGLQSYTAAASWVTVLVYALQIYFDFSGYSDMAIGLGRMFNIELPNNFDSPYKSAGVGEFWRRWHMTLGRAIRAYIYFPLGGSRKGKGRTYLNLFLSFFASGIWHGAAWTFVIWGAAYGVLCSLEKAFQKQLEKIPRALRVAGTFLIVALLFTIFNASNMGKALDIYRGLFNFSNLGFWEVGALAADGIVGIPTKLGALMIYAAIVALTFVVMKCPNAVQIANRTKLTRGAALFTAALFALCVVHMSRGAVFIYFNF